MSARHRRDLDLDPVETRTHDLGGRFARPDIQIDHRAVTQVGPSAWQAIGIVAVALQVLAPRLAPEGFRDRTAARGHRGQRLALFRELSRRLGRFLATCGYRNIGLPAKIHDRLLYDRDPSGVRPSGMNVERDEVQQLLVPELSKFKFRA